MHELALLARPAIPPLVVLAKFLAEINKSFMLARKAMVSIGYRQVFGTNNEQELISDINEDDRHPHSNHRTAMCNVQVLALGEVQGIKVQMDLVDLIGSPCVHQNLLLNKCRCGISITSITSIAR